jgi:uncharacterized repeat protein (TIGR03803 family)
MSLKSFLRLISLGFILITTKSFSQPAFQGMTTEGGPTGNGVIFKLNSNGSGYAVVHSLEAEDGGGGAIGSQGMVFASDGLFYGTTVRGGANDKGILFTFDPLGKIYRKKFDFTSSTGANPFGALIQATNGKIYGTTQWEGPNDYGTLFEYDIAASTLEVKFAWEAGSGQANASFGLTEGDDGILYGTRSTWGSSRKGLVFSYDPVTENYEEQYHFTDENIGRTPNGMLTKLNDGTFLGVTESGGTNGNGTVYHFDPVTKTVIKKAEVGGTGENGAYPVGFLTKHGNGKFYGVTQSGGTAVNDAAIGTIFEYDHSTGNFAMKFSFTSPNGIHPSGKLIAAPDGKLYGKTNEGGTHADNGGTFFSYEPVAETFEKLNDFGGEFGSKPYGSLELLPDGKILGSTSEGGDGNGGVLFEYDPEPGEMTNVRDMNYAPDGGTPLGSFTEGSSRKLLATLSNGGEHGKGVIFEMNSSNGTFTRIADFDGTNGSEPVGQMVIGENGKYYGLTRNGGANSSGVIYRFNHTTKQIAAVYHLDNTSGERPEGSLTIGPDSILYAMTNQGGANALGTIFKFNVETNQFTKIHDFTEASGSRPSGSLTYFNGMLYGLTFNGGANSAGVIFKIDPSTDEYESIFDFNDQNGIQPLGELLVTQNGKLYGLTNGGGEFSGGVLFQFDPVSVEYTVLKNLNESTGKFPIGSLTEGNAGKLFGMTSSGGTHDLGTLFTFDPASNQLFALQNFQGTNGAKPNHNNLFLLKAEQEINFTLEDLTYKASPIQLTGHSNSGLPLLYESSDDNIASVDNNVLTMHRTGPVTITAFQDGNIEFNSATPVANVIAIKLGRPYSLSTSAITEVGFTVTWEQVAGATSYLLDVSTDEFETFASGYEQKSVTSTTQQITGLSADVSYYYRVKAVGAFENSEYSDTVMVLTTVPPAAPVASAATEVTQTTFKAHWTQVEKATSYELDVSTDNFLTFVQPYQAKPMSSSEVISGLTANTIHQYRVHAVNAGGYSISSNAIDVKTLQKLEQKITFNLIADKIEGGSNFTVTATSDSGLPVTFSSTSSSIQLTGNEIAILHAGLGKVEASQPGNEMYFPAPSQERVFCITPSKPTITSSIGDDGIVELKSSASEHNQWYLNGGAVATTQTLRALASGEYKVNVIMDGCNGTLSDSFIVLITSIELEQGSAINSLSLIAYPNPTKDFARVIVPNEHKSIIKISQAYGKVVLRNESYESGQSIDLRDFPNGFYVIEVIQEKQRYVARVVKE